MRVQREWRRFKEVTPDGEGLVSHAGAALLAEAADRLGLTAALSRGLAGMRERRGPHDPGRVVRDLAVMGGRRRVLSAGVRLTPDLASGLRRWARVHGGQPPAPAG